jgi:signal transduction histidine kinase
MKFRAFEITVIFDNLFTNSRKARASQIDISWAKDKDKLVVSFKDNGVGIPTEISSKIFDFGFSNTDGSGIGLYMVRKLLDKYNSTIELNTSNPIGAEFLIKMPL